MKMYTQPYSRSQVLRRDKHDKNKRCPFLGSIFFPLPLRWFIYLESTGTANIWMAGDVPHTEFQSVAASVNK